MDTVEELFFCAEALSMMPRTAGNRVGLLTNAGGLGILISDALAARGFTIPPLSETVKAKLTGRLTQVRYRWALSCLVANAAGPGARPFGFEPALTVSLYDQGRLAGISASGALPAIRFCSGSPGRN